MPGGARLDAPGMLPCEMLRGIEGNSIVEGDEDRLFFGLRMGKVTSQPELSGSFCLRRPLHERK